MRKIKNIFACCLIILSTNIQAQSITDWKSILLSKSMWYVKPMFLGKDTFLVAAEKDMSFEMEENQIVDKDYKYMLYASDEWEFRADTFGVNHKITCGKSLSYYQMTYNIQNDSLLSKHCITYYSKRERDIIVEREDSPFNFQFLKYEDGLLFLRRIEE